MPPKEKLIDFDKLVHTFFQKILLNLRESQHLVSLRDWILPMLMNGQVTVKEAEGRVVENFDFSERSHAIATEKEGEYKTRQI